MVHNLKLPCGLKFGGIKIPEEGCSSPCGITKPWEVSATCNRLFYQNGDFKSLFVCKYRNICKVKT